MSFKKKNIELLTLLSELIKNFEEGKIPLHNFVGRFEELVGATENLDKTIFSQEWMNLESVNADMLDLNLEVPTELGKSLIRKSVKNIKLELKKYSIS